MPLPIRIGAKVALVSLACVVVAACADAYLSDTDAGGEDAASPVPEAAAPADGAAPRDAAPSIDAPADTFDAGTVTFGDDFDRADGAIVPPWELTSVRNGGMALVSLGGGPASDKKLQVTIAQPADGGYATSAVIKRFPFVLLRGKVQFALKVDAFEAIPADAAPDSMHMLAIEFPCAGNVTHIVRAGLRKRSSGFAIFTASQYIPGGYRGSDDSAIRLTTGRFYQITVDYDATTPMAGKPIATVSVDGMVAASVDGTAETAIEHRAPTTFSLGTTSGYGAAWQLQLDEARVVAQP